MLANHLAVRLAVPGIVALLIAAGNGWAQDYRPDAPALALGLSPSILRTLDSELQDDLKAMDAFAGTRTMDRASKFAVQRPRPWTLYGRVGVLNFQNELASERNNVRFGLRRTGPRLTGRLYIGVHREF